MPQVMIVNKYSKHCAVCGTLVNIGDGFARLETSGQWLTYCSVHKPQEVTSVPKKVVTPTERKLTADGKVIIKPWTNDTTELALIRSMPGRRYCPEEQCWVVSTLPKDRKQVLDFAKRLKLEIDSAWQTVPTRAKVAKEHGLYPYQVEGADWLSNQTRAILGDDMGLGKAQPLDAKILTPSGWSTMGDIKVGDKVIGADGKTHTVLGVHPQGVKMVYRVIFSDGSSTRCCEDHLWAVNTATRNYRDRSNKILPLKQFMGNLQYPNGNNIWYIPVVKPIEFDSTPVPCDPYFIGYLIANGNLTAGTPRVSCLDGETANRLLPPSGVRIRHINKIDYSLVAANSQFLTNPLTRHLRDLGLMGKYSYEKFIPSCYLFNTFRVRQELLQGLMDGNGSVSVSDNHLEYVTSSKRLADDFIFLVQSLGGVARKAIKEKPVYTYNGEKRIGKPAYRVSLTLPDGVLPFKLSRKANNYHPRTKYLPTRAVVKVEKIGKAECQCITVDSSDHLYITDDCVVTHNTAMSIMALEDDEAVLLVCPANVKYNWQAEFSKWRPAYKVTIISSASNFRWPEKGEAVITSYNLLPEWLMPQKETKKAAWTTEDLFAARKTTLICDEAHAVKSSKSARHKKIRQLVFKVQKAWFLTGTPLLNKVADLMGMLFALNRFSDTFGSVENFVRVFQVQHNGFGYDWRSARPTKEAPAILRQVMLRRLRQEVLPDLPDIQYQTIVVDTDKVGDMLDTKWEEVRDELVGNELPPFEQFARIRKALAKDRIPAMLEIVEECEEQDVPLVVFSAHREPILALAKRQGWGVILGDTPPKKRQETVDAFQRGELQGVGLTIGAGGVGINLTRAWTALEVDLDWTPGLNEQAERRLLRIGQKNNVRIMRMVSNHPLDMHLHNLLSAKIGLIAETVDGGADA
jgi:hypothetical protein